MSCVLRARAALNSIYGSDWPLGLTLCKTRKIIQKKKCFQVKSADTRNKTYRKHFESWRQNVKTNNKKLSIALRLEEVATLTTRKKNFVCLKTSHNETIENARAFVVV